MLCCEMTGGILFVMSEKLTCLQRNINFLLLFTSMMRIFSQIGAVPMNISINDTDTTNTRTPTVAAITKLTYPEPVANLSVKTEVYNTSKGLLHLSLSWIPPAGYQSDGYNIHVKPSNKSDAICNESLPYYKHIQDKNATNVSVPEFHDVVQAFKIIPGCSYKIVVESNPHDGKTNSSLDYTVPGTGTLNSCNVTGLLPFTGTSTRPTSECVEQVCSCRHADQLPRPAGVTAIPMDSQNLTVSWYLPKANKNDTENITNILVHFGHQIFKNRLLYSMSPAGELKHNASLFDNYHYSLVIKAPAPLRPNTTYKVEVFVLDKKSCRGPVRNFTFTTRPEKIEPSTPPSESVGNDGSLQRVLVTVLPVISFVVVCILAAAMLWQRCGSCIRRKLREGRLQPIHTWRGVYKAVSIDSGTSHLSRNFPTLQQRNPIYVEQEIEEAKARGDADTFEISYSRLELGRQIGKGAFGRVFLARAEAIAGIPGYITVAVKKLKYKASADEVEEFLAEISMMKRVGRHPNVVTMLGCCTLKQPYCMLMEYVPCGDLLQYLRQLRVEYERRTGAAFAISSTMLRPMPRYVDLQLPISDSEGSYIQPETLLTTGRPSITETEWSVLTSDGATITPTDIPSQRRLEYILDPKELQSFAVQIARGMAHLERKQITHRDLAARNVLIDENKTLKISDFGLSRSGIYVNTKRKKVPLRWLSVEAMRDNLYSSKSDVWAFAIVLWEIGTLGGFPYPTVGDVDLLNFLLEGKRLEKPDNCSEELYSLMLQCWSHSADMRPSFAELVSHLDSVICRKRVYVEFSSLKPDYSFPPTEQEMQHKTNNEKNGKSSK